MKVIPNLPIDIFIHVIKQSAWEEIGKLCTLNRQLYHLSKNAYLQQVIPQKKAQYKLKQKNLFFESQLTDMLLYQIERNHFSFRKYDKNENPLIVALGEGQDIVIDELFRRGYKLSDEDIYSRVYDEHCLAKLLNYPKYNTTEAKEQFLKHSMDNLSHFACFIYLLEKGNLMTETINKICLRAIEKGNSHTLSVLLKDSRLNIIDANEFENTLKVAITVYQSLPLKHVYLREPYEETFKILLSDPRFKALIQNLSLKEFFESYGAKQIN